MPKRMTQNQFYCVSCRKRVTCKNDDICVEFFKNRGREVPALRCECKCGTNLTKFIKVSAAEKMVDKYGEC
jgi:hypothetical protein